MVAGAQTLDSLSIDTFCGPARVIPLPTPAGGKIELASLVPYEPGLLDSDFVILNTGWHHRWGKADYYTHFPALSLASAQWLADLGLAGVGLDTPSADSATAEVFAVHQALFSRGMVIIENLTNLDGVPERISFSAYPLPIAGGDGSPVRAVALW
jgi:kynurenine formamidase